MKFNNRNIYVHPNAAIGNNVKIGDNTVIYDNVEVGDNSIICNDCVIGEPTVEYYKNIENYKNPKTVIGTNALIRSHCIIYANSHFGANLITGHRATIREGTKAGDNCLISTLVDIQGNCRIGNYTRIYSNVHVGEMTDIGDFVFIFPYTVFTNDPQPPSTRLIGSKIGDYSIITVHCCILPGIEVGQNCLIGANSVVSRSIEDYSFALGSPAKKICDIRTIKAKENPMNLYYPWPYHFKKWMPWSDKGYEEWITQYEVKNNLL